MQYVPLFRGRTFVVVFEAGLPEPAEAEALLDLKALQEVGVRLVIVVLGGRAGEVADRATDLEIKFARVAEGPGAAGAISGILERGQAVVLEWGGLEPLGMELGVMSRGVGAAKLIALVNGPGVLFEGRPLHAVPCSAAAEFGERAGELEGALMLAAAVAVCEAGVPRVHVLDGRRQGVLADELFSNEGVGTMVHTDSYREVRPLREEDVPELLAMIGRSVRRAHLVPRDYDEIVENSADFLVLCVDDNVVGCVALHRYEQVGEVACLYVKQSHEGLGYGHELVQAAESKAREGGLARLFALTNRAARFFESLGYEAAGIDEVPAPRRKKLKESCRDSVVLVKALN